jgi:hypothetical protein
MIIALQVSNYVLNIKMREINEAESSKNIVEWMNKTVVLHQVSERISD